MKECCIIGGTGFIGSHLVKMLHSQGRRLRVIGRNAIPSRPLAPEVPYLAGDYDDPYFLRAALQGVDEVIMLAYATIPKSSFENPVHDILANLPPAVKLFQMTSELGIEKLVFISSGGTVYGETASIPIAEEAATNPISPYGITKLTTEKYALMFHTLKGLPVICIRPSNAYGEGQKPFTGQGFIATAMASILKRQEVVLYGETGTVRDYIHVADLVQGIGALLKDGRAGECYNIGTGIGKNNRQVLDAIRPFAEALKLPIKIKLAESRRYDVPVNILDCGKVTRETGWKSTITFEEGVKRTWGWMHENYGR